jgi:hypothetical protein
VKLIDTMSVDIAAARSTASTAYARDRTRAFLDGLVHPIAGEAAYTVVLVVTELVTNALRYAGGRGPGPGRCHGREARGVTPNGPGEWGRLRARTNSRHGPGADGSPADHPSGSSTAEGA